MCPVVHLPASLGGEDEPQEGPGLWDSRETQAGRCGAGGGCPSYREFPPSAVAAGACQGLVSRLEGQLVSQRLCWTSLQDEPASALPSPLWAVDSASAQAASGLGSGTQEEWHCGDKRLPWSTLSPPPSPALKLAAHGGPLPAVSRPAIPGSYPVVSTPHPTKCGRHGLWLGASASSRGHTDSVGEKIKQEARRETEKAWAQGLPCAVAEAQGRGVGEVACHLLCVLGV